MRSPVVPSLDDRVYGVARSVLFWFSVKVVKGLIQSKRRLLNSSSVIVLTSWIVVLILMVERWWPGSCIVWRPRFGLTGGVAVLTSRSLSVVTMSG